MEGRGLTLLDDGLIAAATSTPRVSLALPASDGGAGPADAVARIVSWGIHNEASAHHWDYRPGWGRFVASDLSTRNAVSAKLTTA